MVDYGLSGKVAIVTGANNPQGIGAATALALAREGAKVVLIYKKISRNFDPSKTHENGVDRYFAANAGGAEAVAQKLRELGADHLILMQPSSRNDHRASDQSPRWKGPSITQTEAMYCNIASVIFYRFPSS